MRFTIWAADAAPPPIVPETSDVRWGSLLFGLVLLALFVATVVAVVVVWLRRGEPSQVTEAEAILANRFAAGELDTEEFERRRSALRG